MFDYFANQDTLLSHRQWQLILTLANLIPPDPKLYLSFTRFVTYPQAMWEILMDYTARVTRFKFVLLRSTV